MRQTPDLGRESTPLIFWLLAGYFLKPRCEAPEKQDEAEGEGEEEKPDDLSYINSKGIFRVTSVGEEIRAIETHLSQGNFNILTKITDPHLVANYWKRLLREMMEPLITFE